MNGCGLDHRRWKGQIHKSPEVGCGACSERREAVGTMHLSLQADGQTERCCVTMRASFSGTVYFSSLTGRSCPEKIERVSRH